MPARHFVARQGCLLLLRAACCSLQIFLLPSRLCKGGAHAPPEVLHELQGSQAGQHIAG